MSFAPEPFVSVFVPLRLVSEANQREHWSRRHRRAAEQKQLVLLALRARSRGRPRLPCRVEITRIAPKPIRDGDNLHGSAKHVRDAVAHFLGVDDADVGGGPVSWSRPDQVRGPYGVRIAIFDTDV